MRKTHQTNLLYLLLLWQMLMKAGAFGMSLGIRRNGSKDSSDTAKEENLQVFPVIIFLVFASVIIATLYWKRHTNGKETVCTNGNRIGPTLSDHSRVTLICRINRGKFGEIWLGMQNSKPIAVKRFRSSHKCSWENEKQIFSLDLDHPGILKYYGASAYREKDTMSFILIVEYHTRGSLRNCLRSTALSWKEMCKMSLSIAEALAYLHGEIATVNQNRRCIVHRDISSENILVKEDGSCVLCDFGLARSISRDQGKQCRVNRDCQLVGSHRYMAPEALDGYINLSDVISQLKQIDIYALGIVLWEISSRCYENCADNLVPRYRLPFEELGNELTVQNLKNCVLMRNERPPFPNVWRTNEQDIRRLQELISECWDHDPEARLSASCVCHRIIQLKQHRPAGGTENLKTDYFDQKLHNMCSSTKERLREGIV